MTPLLEKLKTHKMLLLCIVACATPFVVILLLVGNQLSLSWIGLILCVGIHLLMFKMMPNHSCHSSKHQEKKTSSDDKSNTLEA